MLGGEMGPESVPRDPSMFTEMSKSTTVNAGEVGLGSVPESERPSLEPSLLQSIADNTRGMEEKQEQAARDQARANEELTTIRQEIQKS